MKPYATAAKNNQRLNIFCLCLCLCVILNESKESDRYARTTIIQNSLRPQVPANVTQTFFVFDYKFIWISGCLLNLYHSGLIQTDDKLICFLIFSQKIVFDIQCKLFPKEIICMKCQKLFSGGKNKENILKCCRLFPLPNVYFFALLYFFNQNIVAFQSHKEN